MRLRGGGWSAEDDEGNIIEDNVACEEADGVEVRAKQLCKELLGNIIEEIVTCEEPDAIEVRAKQLCIDLLGNIIEDIVACETPHRVEGGSKQLWEDLQGNNIEDIVDCEEADGGELGRVFEEAKEGEGSERNASLSASFKMLSYNEHSNTCLPGLFQI